MLKIRGISNAENLLSGVNRFSHCLTTRMTSALAATEGSEKASGPSVC
jgi:hypothetical protein